MPTASFVMSLEGRARSRQKKIDKNSIEAFQRLLWITRARMEYH